MAFSRFLSVLVIVGTAESFKVSSEAHAHARAQATIKFEDYLVKHGRSYQSGSDEYNTRKAAFEVQKQKVLAQNSRSDKSWIATINKFSDRTEAELKGTLGWKPSVGQQKGQSLLQEDTETMDLSAFPETVDWRHLSMAKEVPEQGSCGSCWAVSAIQTLNAGHEIHRGEVKSFSAQELVNCVPNPKECGGQGGCSGATVELGLAWVSENGLALESETPYTAQDGKCAKKQSLMQDSSFLRGSSFDERGGASIGLMGFKTLPSNKESPLVQSVAQQGPVAVSVAADGWFNYYGGVFDSCERIINHAVTLFGYGTEGSKKYWLIKNSWGKDWGEDGFIRVYRTENEEKNCGVDTDPSKGIACKGGPSQVTVCGSCGVLYDSVVPQFEESAKKILAQESSPKSSTNPAATALGQMEKLMSDSDDIIAEAQRGTDDQLSMSDDKSDDKSSKDLKELDDLLKPSKPVKDPFEGAALLQKAKTAATPEEREADEIEAQAMKELEADTSKQAKMHRRQKQEAEAA
eukprot:TRINITY_DN80141_c0_g1_i1.p1 TRINITY_DN80141_c0_g1~~TRINITY_DN80141_c0_g1_i1.p1  ORF type:complete len:519 (+),score=137.75 TRINITY_DN80141_c0_g1_i1:203-1759(+)